MTGTDALTPRRSAVALAILAAVSCAARLSTWPRVFTASGVRFVADSDTHYHLLRARQVLDGQFSRFDPGINFPLGAKVLWPPLFDYVLAAPAYLGLDLEASAAVLPVIFGTATALVFYWVASLFLSRKLAFVAALLFTLSPGALGFTLLGRPDQHILEGLLVLAVVGTFLTHRPVALGSALALSFANWQGSGLYLVLLGTFLAVWYVLRDGTGAGTLALGCAVGAALVAVALGVLCPAALADMSGFGLTGFHVVLMGVTGLFAGVLAVVDARAPPATRSRRAVVVVAATVPACLTLLLVGRSGLTTNALAVGAANRWYLNIQEWQPLFTGHPLRDTLLIGGCGVIAPLAFAAVLRARGNAFRLVFLGTWGVLFVVATVARQRFTLYLAAPAALWAAYGIEAVAARFRSAWLVPVGAVALSLPSCLILLSPLPVKGVEQMMPALDWLRTAPLRAGEEAILADWALGTVARYYSGRPVITSPAGTDGGARVMEDAAQFYLAPDEQEAGAALRARRIGYVFVQNPLGNAFISGAYRAPDCVELDSRSAALVTYAPTDAFWSLPLARLYFSDGRASRRGGALTTFRLLYETNPENMGPPPTGMYKLFGFVPGAKVRVQASPGVLVTASVPLATNVGREFPWSTSAVADASGLAVLQVPYATGPNGFIRAGAYTIVTGNHAYTATVPEAMVVGGGVLSIR